MIKIAPCYICHKEENGEGGWAILGLNQNSWCAGCSKKKCGEWKKEWQKELQRILSAE